MEDPEEEWENRGYSFQSNSGKMSWILDKGLTLGKRVLVTGFVLTSAPVLLPSLVVILTIGLACSVPFGIFLASHACTEKIMSKLLPICPPPPPPPPLMEYGTRDSEGDGGVERSLDQEKGELLDDIEGELDTRVDDDLIEGGNEAKVSVFDSENYDQGGYGIDEKDGVCGVMIAIEGDERSGEINIEEEETPFEVMSMVVGLCEGHDIKEDEEMVKETGGLMEQIRDEGKASNGIEEDKMTEKQNSEVDKAPAGGQGINLSSDKNVSILHLGLPEGSKQSSDAVHDCADCSKFAVAPNTQEFGIAEIPNEKYDEMISSEVLNSEEEIWEQINAIRKIVGFAAPPRATCLEELKALYLFTGIDPSASFKDPSDLAEVNYKLKFLMSIIGVK